MTKNTTGPSVDFRNERQVVAGLQKASLTEPGCRRDLPDCLYWYYGRCGHSTTKPSCVYVSRQARNLGPALGSKELNND